MSDPERGGNHPHHPHHPHFSTRTFRSRSVDHHGRAVAADKPHQKTASPLLHPLLTTHRPAPGREREEPAMTIQPIETRYAGHRFRSRLEARWAVFFDTLGIRWEYEPQGYVLNGTPYLPDFRLHLSDDTSLFAEVKGDADEFEGEHVDLCRALADATSTPALLLIGTPAYRMYHRFTKGLDSGSFQAAFFNDRAPKLTVADAYWFQYVQPNASTGAPEFPHDDKAAKDSFGPGLVRAITAARSARFEHGETP